MNPCDKDGIELHLNDIVVVSTVITNRYMDRGYAWSDSRPVKMLAKVVDFVSNANKSIVVDNFKAGPKMRFSTSPKNVQLADYRDLIDKEL